jgi:hypothetical protein
MINSAFASSGIAVCREALLPGKLSRKQRFRAHEQKKSIIFGNRLTLAF